MSMISVTNYDTFFFNDSDTLITLVKATYMREIRPIPIVFNPTIQSTIDAL